MTALCHCTWHDCPIPNPHQADAPHPAQPAPSYPFATEMQIYISHVNQGGHLDSAQLLTLASEARAKKFRLAGARGERIDVTVVVKVAASASPAHRKYLRLY